MAEIAKLIELLEDETSSLGVDLLVPMIKSGVEEGIFPKHVDTDTYVVNWSASRKMILAFLKNAENKVS